MKNLCLSIGLVFMAFLAHAQNISQIEYFIDNDPGIGNGTALSFTSSNEVTKSFSFSLNNLSDGFHLLSVRAQDNDGDWSNTTYRVFAKFNNTLGTTPAPENIEKVEYFIDNDPGHDNGTAIPITAGQSLDNLAISFPVNSLSDGFHSLSVRAKNADGHWGNTTYRYFVKFDTAPPVNTPPSPIVYLEYFVDNDPGAGNGTSVPISSTTELNKKMIDVQLNSLSNGIHRLSVRSKNQNGDWNQVNYQEFTVKDNVVAIGNSLDAFCRDNAFNVPFSVSGSFAPTNTFTLQLSDQNGSFSSPTVLGTASGNSSGTISAIIPSGTTVAPGYKMRIISSSPTDDEQPIKLFEVLAICPPPCAANETLVSTADDINGSMTLIEVNGTTGYIQASNKILNGANATYNAGRFIELTEGFEAKSGTVFTVEIGGCD
ncbi:hypothetical protein SAMN06298216_3762 [Spirosomataceae bacterium TFI 002]|nr:hypothetical protein SAMN06298216_3762 [Spirosomataceae bacterium TFI 002]